MPESIPFLNLFILGIPLLLSGWLYYKWCGIKWEMGYATLRMISQLLLIGYVLVVLFESNETWVGLLTLLVMTLMSSIIAIRPFKEKNRDVFLITFASVAISGSILLTLVLVGVLRLDPIYQPRLAIPLAGMIYSNCMNSISIAGERYFNETEEGKDHLKARALAYKAALIPQINAFFAVGLVSLPGMMTGQILSGISPHIAVRYQIMVLAMVMGAASLGSGIFLWLIQKKESL